jgi:hypothetical protein
MYPKEHKPCCYANMAGEPCMCKQEDVSGPYIGDGFGNEWSAICPQCKLQTMVVVRPGKVMCSNCE